MLMNDDDDDNDDSDDNNENDFIFSKQLLEHLIYSYGPFTENPTEQNHHCAGKVSGATSSLSTSGCTRD